MGSLGTVTKLLTIGSKDLDKTSIEKDLQTYYSKWAYSEEGARAYAKSDMPKVDTLLEWLGEEPIIQEDPGWPGDVLWKAMVKNRRGEPEARLFEVGGRPSTQYMKDEIRSHRLIIVDNILLPKNIYDTLLKHGNFEEDMVRIANIISKQALKKFRESRGKK